MSLGSLYKPGNKQASYTEIYCNSVNTKSLTFDGTDLLTTLTPDYLENTKSTNQTISNTTQTTITGYDDPTGSLSVDFDKTTGIWTVAETGYYTITACLSWASSAAGGYRKLTANFSTVDDINETVLGTVNIPVYHNLVVNYYLQAGETLQFQCYQNIGGNLDITHFNVGIIRIRP